MSSSTSSSRRAFALAVLLDLGFGALELVVRKKLVPASKDLRRFASYPERAAALVAAPPPRLALFGNSLTDRGVDEAQLARELGVTAEKFVADASHINTWYWMVNAVLWKRGLLPDLIVVHFYENGLEDGRRLEIGRLAQFFADRGDWAELFANDLTTLGERFELIVASGWATFALRDRIKERVFRLIPGYEAYAELENQVNFQHDRQPTAAAAAPPTRKTLARFLRRAQEQKTKILFVAFPTLSATPGQAIPYPVSADTIAQIRAAGMLYLDLRVLPELDRVRHYDDDIHLNEQGRALYTRHLASELRALHFF